MFLLLVACAADPAAIVTDGGSWTLELVEDVLALQGDAHLTVQDADGSTATKLAVLVTPRMDGMVHDDTPVEATEEAEGTYVAALTFSMRGAWWLDGTVADDARSETFSLPVTVE